ncbi:MAG: [protein-PII] uridylyltransferase [Desulfomonile tiedjei]|nr:[protein-PII] uridylyltransferase [Desulfomonile tiedjei]
MRFIFATSERSDQLAKIREGLSAYRDEGAADPGHFQMHAVYDNILGQLSDHFLGYWKENIALVGLGGYGRTEMSPYSDIDMLFLRPDDAPEGVYRGIRSILYLLWDARVELGHSVRTVDECGQEAMKDLAVLTSLMDTRLVWGDERIYRQLVIEREQMLAEADPLDLYLRIEAEIRKSSDRFGHTIYLLEPHLKEGPGSLRYIQLIAWLAKMMFGVSDLADLPAAGMCSSEAVAEAKAGRSFLAEVRARLHFLAARRDDRLKFDAQALLAEQMGFADTPERRGVEAFMREYYRHASTLDFFGRQILARARLFLRPKLASGIKRLRLDSAFYMGAGGINHYEPEKFGSDPREILIAFHKIAETRCDLDIRLVDLIRERIGSMDESLIHDPEANRLFLEILRIPGTVARTLNAMVKIGFLERFIPEFGRVRFLPQHDVYHQYTVDLHTIGVLDEIDSFARPAVDQQDSLLKTIFARLENPEVLYLAGLFHDIAKGAGGGHEVRGEQIARPVLERLRLPAEQIEEVCFLIRNHLAMTRMAFKKDLHDDALVTRFAENVMHKRRLDLLFLLTFADLRAVGTTAYNSWRHMLLEEVYYRTLDVLEGEGQDGEDLADWIRQIKAVIKELVPREFAGPHLDAFVEAAGSRYFLDFYPGVIAEQYVDLRRYLLARGKTAMEAQDLIASKIDHVRPGYSSITLIILDRQGLFFRMAGTLSANRINILGAWSHTIGSIAVATFHVNDIPEGPLDDPERWDHFRKDMESVLKEEADVHELVDARKGARTFRPTGTPRFPLKVEIDNDASDRASIIEVYAHDRPGLLYDITRKLSALELNIIVTKITTEIDQAADIFYVQDETDSKIVDFDRLKEIRASLYEHLVDREEAHFADLKEGFI